jgi:hypothetical protein
MKKLLRLLDKVLERFANAEDELRRRQKRRKDAKRIRKELREGWR